MLACSGPVHADVSGAGLPERVKWMYDESKWGVGHHYIVDKRWMLHINGTEDWNYYIEHFDVDRYAKRMREIGAGHVLFTLGQNSAFIAAPSKVYDDNSPVRPSYHFDLLTPDGVKAQPGTNKADYTPERDLIADLATALKKYNIRLMVYIPSHMPRRFDGLDGYPYRRPDWYAKEFFEELSQRWGDKVSGWFFDGSSAVGSYDNPPNFPLTTKLENATKLGNPNAVAAYNSGVLTACGGQRLAAYSPYDEYTPGEASWRGFFMNGGAARTQCKTASPRPGHRAASSPAISAAKQSYRRTSCTRPWAAVGAKTTTPCGHNSTTAAAWVFWRRPEPLPIIARAVACQWATCPSTSTAACAWMR